MRCPQCKTDLEGQPAQCPRCKADLSILADTLSRVEQLRARAEESRRAGAMGAAVEAYLEMLELDPTDAEAQAAVGQTLRAMRTVLRLEAKPHSMLAWWIITGLVAATAFFLGHFLAHRFPSF